MKENDFPGTFIVIEGADGAGTTTQSKNLAETLNAYWTAEPAKNKIGRKVDEMISGNHYSPEAVALGFAADRMVHLEEEVIPRLKEGKTVVSDRYYHSSLVYQSVLGAERDWIEHVNDAAVMPDLTVILDISAEEGMERRALDGSDGHIFEELSFQQQVVVLYRKLEEQLGEDLQLVDASKSKKEVFNSVLNAVETVGF